MSGKQFRPDHNQTPHYAASDLGLHYLCRPVCPNTYGIEDINLKGLKPNTVDSRYLEVHGTL